MLKGYNSLNFFFDIVQDLLTNIMFHNYASIQQHPVHRSPINKRSSNQRAAERGIVNIKMCIDFRT